MISKTIVASLWKASLFLSLIVLLQSCTPNVVTSNSGSYKEDLSKYRPQLEEYTPLTAEYIKQADGESSSSAKTDYPEPTNHIKDEIDQVVQMTIDYNKSRGYFIGFSIQVHSGTEISEVNDVEDKLHSLNYAPNTEFDSPIYRTKIGRYYTRLEANKDFNEIKRIFPLAVLVSEKIKIK